MSGFDELLRGVAAAPRLATTDERIGARLGRFRLVSKLGFGATAVVYRAHDEALDREVAVKMLRKRFPIATQRAWLSCEAKRASRVKHPNIACVYDVGEAAGVFFVVMELVDGESVSRRMPAGGYEWEEALRIVRAVAAGLAAAHEAGLVHGDLTPTNIALDRDGTPKLLDFGLAMASGDRRVRGRGSKGYASPEQWRGEPIDARADVYSLGRVLEAIARSIPQEGLAIVGACTAFDREARLPSACEVLKRLAR